MDRFIENIQICNKTAVSNLKSNMDRFIAESVSSNSTVDPI